MELQRTEGKTMNNDGVLSVLREIIDGIKEDDVWNDDWCPVCHEHPSHDHGGKDCPLVRAETLLNSTVD